MKELVLELRGIIAKHPTLKEQINDLFQLCKDEIEEGGSTENEISLCLRDVYELVEEIEKK